VPRARVFPPEPSGDAAVYIGDFVGEIVGRAGLATWLVAQDGFVGGFEVVEVIREVPSRVFDGLRLCVGRALPEIVPSAHFLSPNPAFIVYTVIRRSKSAVGRSV
jgi:hypothetical protein